MSLLSHDRLCGLIEEGIIDAPFTNVNATSIYVTLDEIIKQEAPIPRSIVTLKNKDRPSVCMAKIPTIGILLPARSFLACRTVEMLNLPNSISADFRLTPSLMLGGLGSLGSTWIQPGFERSQITLTLQNCLEYHELLLNAKMIIGQLVFFEHAPKIETRNSMSQIPCSEINAERSIRNPEVEQPQPERRRLYKDY